MAVGNVERIIKKYIAQIHSKNSAIPKYFFIMYDTVLSTELVIISIFFNSIDSPIYTFSSKLNLNILNISPYTLGFNIETHIKS